MGIDIRGKIILALDVADYDEALNIVKEFKEDIEIFKIGSELFISTGPKIIDEINSMGKKVFLDLKCHDIPDTVRRSAEASARLGVFMLTLHTMGGLEMMKGAVDGVVNLSLRAGIPKPKLLGVTILTSIDEETLTEELGITHNLSSQVRHLTNLAIRAGLDGVVASARELELLRLHFGRDLLIVTPGIRPSWSQQHDQKRVMTPREALIKGSDYLVVGRPILSHPEPRHAFELLVKELSIG